MVKKITRTFQFNEVTIKNAVTGEVIKEETVAGKITKKQVMKHYLKETEDNDVVSVLVEIEQKEEKREMSLETFLSNSTVVEEKEESEEE